MSLVGVLPPVEPGSIVVLSGATPDAAEAIRREIAAVVGHDRFLILLAEDNAVVAVLGPDALGGPLRALLEAAGAIAPLPPNGGVDGDG